LNILCIS